MPQRSILLVLLTVITLAPALGHAQLRLTNARVTRDLAQASRCVLSGQATHRRENVIVEDRRGRARTVVRQVTTQAARCVMRDAVEGFPQARVVVEGSVVYEKVGSAAWHFDGRELSTRTLEGMPPVDRAALTALVQGADPALLFGFNQLHSITAFRGVAVQADAELWPDPLQVRLKYVADVDWRDRQRLDTFSVALQCRFVRESANAAWSLNRCHHETSDRQVRSTRELARGEDPPNLLVQAELRAAEARRASMPQVEVPRLSTEYELVDFVFRIFHEEPRPRAEAFLYRLFAPSFYLEGGTTLKPEADALIRAALDAAYGEDGGFRGQYCRRPVPRDNVSWSNRGGVSYSRITGRQGPNGFRLTALDVNVLHGRGVGNLAPPSTCTEELPGGFHLGDHVRVDYYGTEREGFVVGSSGAYPRVMFGRSQNDVESMDVAKVRPF